MGRKLLAMDVDGTAVCDDYSMGQKSKEAIEAARQAGHVTAFVTGRRDMDMLSMDEDQWCVDYQILNTGGKVIRCRDREVFCNELIPPHLEGISPEFRGSISHLVTHAVTQRIDAHMEVINRHPVEIRRYYRQFDY